MGAVLTVFKREIAAYFNVAIAYIFIIVFVLLNGGLFMTQFFIIGLSDMRPFFITLPFILSVFLPAVTMRLWAEERRGNTLELLLTFPMGTHQLVIGKFLAGFVFYLAALAGTLVIPLMQAVLGRPDAGMIFGGYLGAALLGSFFLAIGIFISGLCRDQIVAFILAMIVCFGLHLLGTEFMASSIDGWIPGLGSFLRHFFGSSGHFESFAKGVVDNRDVLYFAIGTAIFLVLNGFWLEGRMRPGAKKIFTAATLISIGIFFSTNWLFSGIPLGRFDLTQGNLYTISPATKKILRELKAPVTAKFYVSPSDKMPTGMKTLEQDVIDKLDELRIASKGKFNYKIFHMEAANIVEGKDHEKQKEESLEQQLQRKGIQPFQIRAIESDEVVVRLVYAALSLGYKEKSDEMVPRITPDMLNEMEYLIASKVYRMTLAQTPKLALVAPYEEKSVDPELAALLAQLGQHAPEGYREDQYELLPLALEYEGYQVSRIRLTDKDPIPKDTKTLVLVEPENLTERQRYEINRFLRGGGSVFLAVQQYIYNYAPSGRELEIFPKKNNPGINPLLSAWGFEVDEHILVDEQHDVINISGGARLGPFEVSVPVKVPIQILITETGMNQNVSITSRLSPIFYLWGTAVKINDEKIKSQNVEAKTLLSSSPHSWTVPFQPGGVLTPRQLQLQPESRKGPLPVAVFAQGQFADAFEGKPVPDWPQKNKPAEGQPAEKENAAPPPAAITPAPGKLILAGAVTFLQKQLIKSGGHLNFFLNSVDALTLGDELVTIRSKQPIDRSLGRVSAASKVIWRFFVTVFIPLWIAVIGTLRVFLRKKSKQNYLKNLAAARS